MQYARTTLLKSAAVKSGTLGSGAVLPADYDFDFKTLKPVRFHQFGDRTKSVDRSYGETKQSKDNDGTRSDSDDSDIEELLAAATTKPFEACSTDQIRHDLLLPQPPTPSYSSESEDDYFCDGHLQSFNIKSRVSFHDSLSETVKSDQVTPDTPFDFPPLNSISTLVTKLSSVMPRDKEPIPDAKQNNSIFKNIKFGDFRGPSLLHSIESKLNQTHESFASTVGRYTTKTNKLFTSIESEIISATLSAVISNFHDQEDQVDTQESSKINSA